MVANNQNMWEQMQKYEQAFGDIQSQLGSLQNMLGSGNVMTVGDQGLLTVGGGVNRYGQARPSTVLMRGKSGELDPRFVQTMTPEFEALRAKAMTEGDTKSAQLAREQQGLMAQEARDALQAQGASAQAGAMRNLAMRGGASTGARERIGRDVARQLMSGAQGIGREGRMANLAISMQDEAMKNQLLGQTGMIGQKLQEANINRLQQDVTAQNLAAHNLYSEDMRAFAAQQSAAAQSAAACFTGDTMFLMKDGARKPIAEIMIGDVLAEGGKVYFTCRALSSDLYLYDEKDTVAGSHAVKEDGEWIRVKDSKKAKKLNGEWAVFNVGCRNHIMITESNVYSDFFETDRYEDLTIEESLEALNGRLG